MFKNWIIVSFEEGKSDALISQVVNLFWPSSNCTLCRVWDESQGNSLTGKLFPQLMGVKGLSSRTVSNADIEKVLKLSRKTGINIKLLRSVQQSLAEIAVNANGVSGRVIRDTVNKCLITHAPDTLLESFEKLAFGVGMWKPVDNLVYFGRDEKIYTKYRDKFTHIHVGEKGSEKEKEEFFTADVYIDYTERN